MFIIRDVHYQRCSLPEMFITRDVHYQRCSLPEMFIIRDVHYQRCSLPEMFIIMCLILLVVCANYYYCLPGRSPKRHCHFPSLLPPPSPLLPPTSFLLPPPSSSLESTIVFGIKVPLFCVIHLLVEWWC